MIESPSRRKPTLLGPSSLESVKASPNKSRLIPKNHNTSQALILISKDKESGSTIKHLKDPFSGTLSSETSSFTHNAKGSAIPFNSNSDGGEGLNFDKKSRSVRKRKRLM